MYDKEFSEFKLEVLKRVAEEWAQKYPIIKKVLLCRASKKYSKEKNRNLKYILVVLAPKYRENENRVDEVKIVEGEEIWREPSYCNWAQDNCEHVSNDLMDAYINRRSFIKDNWWWYNISAERETPNEFIVSESMLILFTRSSGKRIRPQIKEIIQRAHDEGTNIYKYLAMKQYDQEKPEKWKSRAIRKFDDPCLRDSHLYDLRERTQRKRNFINRFIQSKLSASGINGVTQKQIDEHLKSTLSRAQ